MITLTRDILVKVMPRLGKIQKQVVDLYVSSLNEAMKKGDINTKERVAMFLAQISHESYQLKYTREIWDPNKVPNQTRYERDFSAAWPPTPKDKINKLAYMLGNLEKGDGYSFRGSGALQITGRENVLKSSKFLYNDDRLVKNPVLLEDFSVGINVCVWYWSDRNLNSYADKLDIVGCTQKINGGQNGIEDRKKYYDLAMKVL